MYVRSFSELGAGDLALAGGKGANLGELVQAGLPVPPGFVLVTSAYRAFVTESGLGPELERALAQVDEGDPHSVEAASTAIRALFEPPVPKEIAQDIGAAYDQLGGGAVAVRSSATTEDLPGASFAGQHDTYLNVVGSEQLVAAVLRCWSSLFTPRAITYRLRQGVPSVDLALAVVVQRLVPAESAGVLFTANPVTGHRGQLVIEASWGLGEAIVSGQVTPDQWIIDADSGDVVETRVGTKEVMTAARAGGTETVAVTPEQQERLALEPAYVARLAELGRRVASHFGVPQDIEWVLADGQLSLVQSRPVTSLFPLPAPPSDAGLRVYLNVNSLQGLAEPLTPAGIDFLGRLACGPAELLGIKLEGDAFPPVFKWAAGRIYVDATEGLCHPITRRFIFGSTTFLDLPARQILEDLLERETRLRRLRLPPVHPPPGLVLRVLARALAAFVAPARARRRALHQVERFCLELEGRTAGLQTPEERRRFLMEEPRVLFPMVIPTLLPVVAPGIGMRFLAESRLAKWLGDRAGLEPVLRALPHNPTTEMGLALWHLSREFAQAGERPSSQHPDVSSFLSKYGHRAIREIDIGMPRWSDDPTYVVGVLETYLAQGDDVDAEAHFRSGVAKAEAAVEELVAEVRQRKGPVRAALLRFMLSRVRALAGMREYPKFFFVRLLASFRKVLGELGVDSVATGLLDAADDIYFVRFADWDGDLRAAAAAGRAEYARNMKRSAPRVITSEGETFYSPAVTDEGALVGTAAAAGVYEGPVRIVEDPRGATLEGGDVLVVHGTDPAWTPLFLTAGALVMEIGGIMSHGSVVAREYGTPAVVGVPEATRRLRTGERVRVDGESGTVIRLEPVTGSD